MNATDSYDRVVRGFADLVTLLESRDKQNDVAARERRSRIARDWELARVRSEYAAEGLEPPSELALSVTARREIGLVSEAVKSHLTDDREV